MLLVVLLELVDVETLGAEDSAIVFDDANDFAPELGEESGGVVADVAKALHDDGLALHSGNQTFAFALLLVLQVGACAKNNA